MHDLAVLIGRRFNYRLLLGTFCNPILIAVCIAGVCSALLAGLSLGGRLLHLLIALLATVPKLSSAAAASVKIWQITLQRLWPGMAWSMLTIMLIVLYLALTPSRRRGRLTYAGPVQT